MGQSTRLPLHVRAYTLGCREPKKASQKGDPLGEVKGDKKGDGAKSDELDDEAGRGFLQAGRTTQVPYGLLLVRCVVVYMPSIGAPGGLPCPALPIDFPVRNCTPPKYGVMTARFQHPVRDHVGRHLVMYSRHHLQTESGGQTAM